MRGTFGGDRFGRLERVGSRPNSSSHLCAERFDAWRSVFIHSCDVVSDGADRVYVREDVNIANAAINNLRLEVYTEWFLRLDRSYSVDFQRGYYLERLVLLS